jgi:hypothetical protein
MVDIPNRAKLKMASLSAQSDANGDVSIDIKIPGTVGVDSRLISGGVGWFDAPQDGDRFLGVEIRDNDSLVIGKLMSEGMTLEEAQTEAVHQYPNYPLLGAFHEETVEAPLLSGWFMNENEPTEVHSIGGEEELMSGLYLRFLAKKATAVIGTFRVNIFWGDPRV